MDFLDFKNKLELFIKEYDCMIDIKNSDCDVVNGFSRIIFKCEGQEYSLELDRLYDDSGSSGESSSSDDTYWREPPRSESLKEIYLN